MAEAVAHRQREDFTSEAFKIEVRNIANYGFGEIKKFLKKKLELNPVKIKAQPGHRDFAYLCFRNEEERTVALAKLDGYVWKGKTIRAAPAKAIADPLLQKRLNTPNNNADLNSSGSTAKSRTILEATAPLAHLPYAEQLRQKEADLLAILRSYGQQVRRLNRSLKLPAAQSATAAEPDALPCRWLGFQASPQIDGYRNKSEFSVGYNAAGEKVVGFRLSSYVNGSIEVDYVAALPHIPEPMKLAAEVWQTFVRASAFDVFSPEFYSGVYRQLTVRVSVASGEVMLVIGVHSDALQPAELDTLRASIREYFEADGEGATALSPASVYLEHMNKRAPGQLTNRIELLVGRTHITDTIHGLRFRISPESFFQVNTLAAEQLYRSAIELGAPTERTTVMDICCGTGTIGICFAKHCHRVVGVEIVPQAIEDAAHNARENGVENCTFYAGNCDDYIRKFVYDNRDDDLLAVIDPPRAGLHINSIASLRSSKGLNRFVYISCSPKAALRNWVDLARPSSKSYRGNPFVVTAATGVDMFPHTHHKEMVLLFERVVDDVAEESSAGAAAGDAAASAEATTMEVDVAVEKVEDVSAASLVKDESNEPEAVPAVKVNTENNTEELSAANATESVAVETKTE